MDNTVQLFPILCWPDYSIIFNLNLIAPPDTNPTPNYYGKLDIQRVLKMGESGGFPHIKTYSFLQFSEIFPQIKNITVHNFIENIPLIVSIFEKIIFNNNNTWIVLPPTDENPTERYMNFKTNETLQECPENIYPWVVKYVEEEGVERRPYYVNGLTFESSWNIPEDEELNTLNTALREIISCLLSRLENPDKTLALIEESIAYSKKIYKERKDKERVDEIMNKKITRIFVIIGHSECSEEQINFERNMCVLTVSKLGDFAIYNNELFELEKLLSDIKQISSQDVVVGSYVKLAERYRDTELFYPLKDKSKSIRVRCGDKGRGKVTNQDFFGFTKKKKEKEGIFMIDNTQPDGTYQDISMQILTRAHAVEKMYPETTEFQKKIIEFESRQPDDTTVIPLQVYKTHFKDEPEFDSQFENLKTQRRLFCNSLDYTKSPREIEEDVLRCQGIDVMTLQHYYDSIVTWERDNTTSAFDYFQTHGDVGLEAVFFKDEDENRDKRNKLYFVFLSVKRFRQIDKQLEKHSEIMSRYMPEYDKNVFKYDYQKYNSLYETESCDNILKRIQALYPEDEKLIMFKGCRGVDNEEAEPYHSDNEDVADSGGERRGKRKQHLITNIKNTYKKNKKSTRTRNGMKHKKSTRTRNRMKHKKSTRTRNRMKHKKIFI